jgi:hypothetical protein
MTENLPKQNAAPRPCAARRPSHVAIRGKRNISGTANLLVISCRVLPWSTTAASPSNVLSSTLTRTALCPRLVAIYVVAGLCGSARHRDGLKAAWVRMSSTAGRPAPPQAPWPRLARRTDRSCQGGPALTGADPAPSRNRGCWLDVCTSSAAVLTSSPGGRLIGPMINAPPAAIFWGRTADK